MTDRELMQQALDSIIGTNRISSFYLVPARRLNQVITALRERLAQPEHEPVAWMNPSWIDPDTRGWASDSFESIAIEGWIPVYTAPNKNA